MSLFSLFSTDLLLEVLYLPEKAVRVEVRLRGGQTADHKLVGGGPTVAVPANVTCSGKLRTVPHLLDWISLSPHCQGAVPLYVLKVNQ